MMNSEQSAQNFQVLFHTRCPSASCRFAVNRGFEIPSPDFIFCGIETPIPQKMKARPTIVAYLSDFEIEAEILGGIDGFARLERGFPLPAPQRGQNAAVDFGVAR